VQLPALDFGQTFDSPGFDVDGRQVGNLAGIIEPEVNLPPSGIVEGPGHRSQPLRCQGLEGRHRIPADPGQVILLPGFFSRDPGRPFPGEGQTERPLELGREISLASLFSRRPGDDFLRAVFRPQVGEKPGAVHVGQSPDLKVHGRSLGFQPKGVVEKAVLKDFRPEHHLVVGPETPPQAPVRPGLHEDGDPLQVPPRGIRPGAR